MDLCTKGSVCNLYIKFLKPSSSFQVIYFDFCGFDTSLELSFNSTVVSVASGLFCIQHFPCAVCLQRMLGSECGFEQRTYYTSSCRVKLILACQEVLGLGLAPNESV